MSDTHRDTFRRAHRDDPWLRAKGLWRPARMNLRGKIVRTATVSCPRCGCVASLSQHSIDEHGIVSPSLVCPAQACDYHEFARLEGWESAAQ